MNLDNKSKLGQMNQKAVTMFTKLTEFGDKLSKAVVWSAMYNKQIAQGQSEVDAAYAASDLVNRTMSVTNPMSLASAQTSRNPFIRLFFLFSNDLFQMWNVMFGDIPLDWRNGKHMQAFEKFGGLMLAAAALALLSGGWAPDEDDKDKVFSAADFAADLFQNMLGYSVPLVGGKLSDYMGGYSGSNLITFPEEFFKLPNMMFQDLSGDEEYTTDEYFDQVMSTLGSAAELAGIPVISGIKRPVQTIYDFDSDEFRFNIGYLFGSRFGQWGDAVN